MENRAQTQDWNWIPALLAALLLGVGLHELFRLWPSIVTEFIAPVNNSIWEHVKVVFWPLLLVELGCAPPHSRSGGLLTIVLCCAGMLLAGWLYHIVLGGSALWVDLLIYGVCIWVYYPLSAAAWVQKVPAALSRFLILLLILLIVLFTLNPPHGALFSDPTLLMVWAARVC